MKDGARIQIRRHSTGTMRSVCADLRWRSSDSTEENRGRIGRQVG